MFNVNMYKEQDVTYAMNVKAGGDVNDISPI